MDVVTDKGIQKELARVGEILATRRGDNGSSIEDVSAALRILPEYLNAVENGDLDKLPAPTYFIGYVRSYANYLGLPAAELCQSLHNALSDNERRPEFDFIENKALSPSGSGRVALASVLAGVLLYAGWYVIDTGMIGGSNDEVIPEQIVAETVEETVPEGEPIFVEVEPYSEVASTSEPSSDTTSLEGGDTVVEADVPETIVETGIEPETEVVADSPAVTENPVVDDTIDPIPSAATAIAHNRDPNSELIITAIGTSWIELTRPDGSQIAAWLMRAGETYTVSGDEDVYLTTGNAGGISIADIDGQSVIPGNWGEAIRELPLDVQLITDRSQ